MPGDQTEFVPQRATVRLRRLASELRRYRTRAKLSQEDVADRMGVNAATIVRIESAKNRPRRLTLQALLDVYGIRDQARRSELIALREEATEPGWLRPYEDVLPEQYTTYIGFESEARSVRNYEIAFVPGMLQTERYTRAVIAGTLPGCSDEDAESRVEVRKERQGLLAREGNPLHLVALIDESVIRRPVGGPEVMVEQLLALAAEDRPHVTLQVIPYTVGPHPGLLGSFVVMDFVNDADADLVYIDSLAGDHFLEKEVEIRRYSAMFDHLRAQALDPADSARLIYRAAEEITARKGSRSGKRRTSVDQEH